MQGLRPQFRRGAALALDDARREASHLAPHHDAGQGLALQPLCRAGAAEPAKIREALIATDYTGPTGRLRFDAKGQVYGQSVFLVELKGGSPVIKADAKMEKPN